MRGLDAVGGHVEGNRSGARTVIWLRMSPSLVAPGAHGRLRLGVGDGQFPEAHAPLLTDSDSAVGGLRSGSGLMSTSPTLPTRVVG